MPEIQAFRGIRYDLGSIGSLSDVIAPPYDVIGPELHDELYKKHPCNIIRIDLNRMEPGDDEASNRYTRAARFFKAWRDQGVLFEEAQPAIYVYHQEFEVDGTRYVRRGFMARMRISPFGEGLVFPHEQTFPGPKLDRLMLTVVTKANLSQIFGLYPDPEREADAILDQAIASQTPLEAVDHLGVIHRLWAVTDMAVISALAGKIGPKPVFIADGHHRYETAVKYRDEVYESGFLKPDAPANYVLMMFVAMEDPGLIVLPTHRLFKTMPELSAEELRSRLESYFSVRDGGEGPEAAPNVWEDVQTASGQDVLAFYTRKDNRWTIAQLTAAGKAKMDEVTDDHDATWKQLGVSILHRLVIETILGRKPTPDDKANTDFVHSIDEVVEGLKKGDYPLAALVMPASVEHVREISMQRDRMPQKSTYFYPKLVTGLVINPLE